MKLNEWIVEKMISDKLFRKLRMKQEVSVRILLVAILQHFGALDSEKCYTTAEVLRIGNSWLNIQLNQSETKDKPPPNRALSKAL